MPAPTTYSSLVAAGHKHLRWGHCEECGEPIEWWLSLGGREFSYNRMGLADSPAVRHYTTCRLDAQ